MKFGASSIFSKSKVYLALVLSWLGYNLFEIHKGTKFDEIPANRNIDLEVKNNPNRYQAVPSISTEVSEDNISYYTNQVKDFRSEIYKLARKEFLLKQQDLPQDLLEIFYTADGFLSCPPSDIEIAKEECNKILSSGADVANKYGLIKNGPVLIGR